MKLGRGFSVVFADGADDSYSVSAFAGRRPSFSKQRVGGGGGNPARLVTGLYIGGSGK